MSVRRYLRPFYGWLVEKRECDRALFEYQVLGIVCVRPLVRSLFHPMFKLEQPALLLDAV